MSMINVKREVINNNTYLVTDYIYNNDNIGINLQALVDAKTKKCFSIPCLPMSGTERSFSNTANTINIESVIGLDVNDNIQAVFNIAYPDKTDTQYVSFSDIDFATDMINTCILDKHDVKDLACYKQAIDQITEKVKQSSLAESILIKTPELNYKCYIYTENLTLLGTANRLLDYSHYNGHYILGEYCGKKLTDYIDEYGDTTKLVIDVCINEDIVLQLTNVELLKSVDSTMGYARVNMDHAKAVKINNSYNSISYKLPQNIVLPEYRNYQDYETYFDNFLMKNSPDAIDKFYKLNKISTNPVININKYLIW